MAKARNKIFEEALKKVVSEMSHEEIHNLKRGDRFIYYVLPLTIGDLKALQYHSDKPGTALTEEQKRALIALKGENLLPVIASLNGFKNALYLLLLGADVNSRDALGRTALHYACEYYQQQIVHRETAIQFIETLKAHGADFSIEDNNGHTPLSGLHPVIKDLILKLTNSEPAAQKTIKDYSDSTQWCNNFDADIEEPELYCEMEPPQSDKDQLALDDQLFQHCQAGDYDMVVNDILRGANIHMRKSADGKVSSFSSLTIFGEKPKSPIEVAIENEHLRIALLLKKLGAKLPEAFILPTSEITPSHSPSSRPLLIGG